MKSSILKNDSMASLDINLLLVIFFIFWFWYIIIFSKSFLYETKRFSIDEQKSSKEEFAFNKDSIKIDEKILPQIL